MTNESKEMTRAYYTRENFPELVAHSHGWDIYAQSKPSSNGFTYCAAIPATLDRLPHQYGTIEHVARMIAQGHLRPVIGNRHRGVYVITGTKGGKAISRNFETLEEAKDTASRIYRETGAIVGIEARGKA
jgi:hypothetical protein